MADLGICLISGCADSVLFLDLPNLEVFRALSGSLGRCFNSAWASLGTGVDGLEFYVGCVDCIVVGSIESALVLPEF